MLKSSGYGKWNASWCHVISLGQYYLSCVIAGAFDFFFHNLKSEVFFPLLLRLWTCSVDLGYWEVVLSYCSMPVSLQLSSWVRSNSKMERWKPPIFIMQTSAFVWNTTQGVAMSFNFIMGHQSPLPMLATPVSSQLASSVPGIIPSPHTNIWESKVISCLFPREDPIVCLWTGTIRSRGLC